MDALATPALADRAAPPSSKPLRGSEHFVRRVPIHFARTHRLLGMESDDPQRLTILVSSPESIPVAENLALRLDRLVDVEIVDERTIEAAIDAAYQEQTFDLQQAARDARSEAAVEILEDGAARADLLDQSSCAPVVRLVNQTLFEAAQRRASDIHVQPLENDLIIRFRIDGVLLDFVRPGSDLHEELVSRIKVMSGLDIAEKRLPQDGRATVRIGSRLIDLRVSIIPTAHGERAVLRLLDKGARHYELALSNMQLVGGQFTTGTTASCGDPLQPTQANLALAQAERACDAYPESLELPHKHMRVVHEFRFDSISTRRADSPSGDQPLDRKPLVLAQIRRGRDTVPSPLRTGQRIRDTAEAPLDLLTRLVMSDTDSAAFD